MVYKKTSIAKTTGLRIIIYNFQPVIFFKKTYLQNTINDI